MVEAFIEMTTNQFGECIVAGRIVDKLVRYLVKQFRRANRADSEDIAHTSLVRAARTPEKFLTQESLEAYLYESSKFAMIQYLQRERERRQTLRNIPYSRTTHRDPSRTSDYRIDLERSIRKSARANSLRQALWMHIVEGWDFDELTPRLPSERAKRTWYNYLRDGMVKTRQEMRRKGYYRFARVRTGP